MSQRGCWRHEHFHLWLFKGAAPVNGQEAEVVISRFAFIPLQPSAPRVRSASLDGTGTSPITLNLKRRIAADLIAFFGEDVIRRLLDGVKPRWESDLRTVRERHLGQVENASDTTRIAAH